MVDGIPAKRLAQHGGTTDERVLVPSAVLGPHPHTIHRNTNTNDRSVELWAGASSAHDRVPKREVVRHPTSGRNSRVHVHIHPLRVEEHVIPTRDANEVT